MKKHLAFLMFIGLFTFSSFNAFAQPANDDCSGAISLTVGADEASATPVAGTTIGATASGPTVGTGSPASVCSGSWFGDDVWYSFTTGATAPSGGVTVKVIPGTFGILGMAVYTSCDTGATPISCMSQQVDDFMTLPFLQANTTYNIRMWSGGGATTNAGTFDIIVYENPADPNADIVLWGANPGEGDFNGGLNNWTTSAIGAGDEWVWAANASANGAFRSNTIVSPTASNGAMVFDADFKTTSVNPNPPQPYPVHVGELISPVIDCSTFGDISVKFYQSYEALNGTTYFSYSVDGGNTFSALIDVNADVAGNEGTPQPSIKRVGMPGAGGSSQVVLKFTGDMDFYNWIIDDVQLVEKENNNVALANSFAAGATSYSMPIASIDTLRFLSDIANIGGNTQYNVTLSVDVVNSTGTSVFSDSNNYGTMMAGDTIENQLFASTYLPPAAKESYTVTYSLTSDSTDAFPGDNTRSFQFEIVDSVFAKEPNATRNIRPAGDNAFAYGTSFYAMGGNDGVTHQRYVLSIGFGVGNPTDAVGETINLFLEKPTNGDQFFTLNDGILQSGSKEVVAFGNYTVTGNEVANEVFYVEVSDFATGGLYPLDENTLYAVMASFTPSATDKDFFLAGAQSDALNYGAADFAAGLSGSQRFSQLLDVGNSGDYSTVGFSGNPVAAVRLQYTEYLVYTNNVELDDNAVTIFPNPAVDHITATIELEEQAQNARFVIYNLAGQIMETRNLSNVQNEQVQFNLDNYASGTYFMTIDTDKGHTIKRFVVNK